MTGERTTLVHKLLNLSKNHFRRMTAVDFAMVAMLLIGQHWTSPLFLLIQALFKHSVAVIFHLDEHIAIFVTKASYEWG